MKHAPIIPLVLFLAACPSGRGPDHPTGSSQEGLSLTYYADRKATPEATTVDHMLVVEQRRWIDVGADKTLDIDQIDDGADLESLVIESLSNPGGLVLGGCSRDLISLHGAETSWIGRKGEITVDHGRTATGTVTAVQDGKVLLAGDDGTVTAIDMQEARSFRLIGGGSRVRCQVESGAGKQLVRVVYTTPGLTFASEQQMVVKVDAKGKGTAAITPRFTVYTPPWQIVADVSLYDGVPGGAHPPHEVFHGPVTLTGDAVIVAGTTKTVPAEVLSIFRGAISYPGEPPHDTNWHYNSTVDVWDYLELDLGDDTMPPGRVMLEVSQGDDPVPQPAILEADAIEMVDPASDQTGRIRIKLWQASDLRGQRQKWTMSTLDTGMVESVLCSVANGGSRPREVVVEEEMRPARRREVDKPFPRKPTVRNGILRTRLTVPPGGLGRVGYVLNYEW